MPTLGRPTKYPQTPKVLSAKLAEMDKLFSKGKSIARICVDVWDITVETFNEWRKDPDKPEFSEAVNRGLIKSQAWWEDEAQKCVRDNCNPQVLALNLKNRFPADWREKSEIESTNTTKHELSPETAAFLEAWGKK